MMPHATLRRLGFDFRIEWFLRGLFAAVLLAGCGLPPLRVIRYHDRDVIIARPEIVDAFCSDTAGKWDDGTPKAKGAAVGGCYQKNPTIWLKEPPNIETAFHEDGHHDCRTYAADVEICERKLVKERRER